MTIRLFLFVVPNYYSLLFFLLLWYSLRPVLLSPRRVVEKFQARYRMMIGETEMLVFRGGWRRREVLMVYLLSLLSWFLIFLSLSVLCDTLLSSVPRVDKEIETINASLFAFRLIVRSLTCGSSWSCFVVDLSQASFSCYGRWTYGNNIVTMKWGMKKNWVGGWVSHFFPFGRDTTSTVWLCTVYRVQVWVRESPHWVL